MDDAVFKALILASVLTVAGISHAISLQMLDAWYLSNSKILGKIGPGRQKARVSRAIASAWLYTVAITLFVLVSLNTAVLSIDIPFANKVMSWDFGVTIDVVVVFVFCMVVAAMTSVARFSGKYKDKTLDACAFRESVATGAVPFFILGTVGLFLMLFVLPDPEEIDESDEMESELAATIFGDLGGETNGFATDGFEGDDPGTRSSAKKWRGRLKQFMSSFPTKGGLSNLKQRMRSFGFRKKSTENVISKVSSMRLRGRT